MLVGSLGTNIAARVRMVALEDPLLLADYLGLAVVLLLVQALASVVVGAFMLSAAHSLVGGYLLVVFAVYSVLNLACTFLRDGLYAFGHNNSASGGDALAAGIQLIVSLVLFGIWGSKLVLATVALIVGALGELVYLSRKYVWKSLSLRPCFRLSGWRTQIRAGLPAMVVSMGQAMVIRFDRVLLGILASTGQVGVYSVAASMSETLWLIPASISQVVFHRVASARTPVYRLRKIRILNVALASLGAGVLAVLAPVLIRVLFGEAFRPAVGAMRVLLIAGVAVASYQVDVSCVSAANRLGRASGITSAGFAAVLMFDIALIPHFGFIGAAWASVVAYGLMAVLAALMVARIGSAERHSDPAGAETSTSGEGG